MRNIKPFVLTVAVAGGSICWPETAQSAPITWQLSNGFFAPEDGGGAWTGSFVFDATTGTITEWNISVEGGVVFPQQIPSYNYTSSSPTASALYQSFASGAAEISFSTTPERCDSSQPQRCLILEITPLPQGGGEVTVLFGEEIFTPVPFNSFIRTMDTGKNPQLISLFVDSDGDGVLDVDDACLLSDLSATVIINGCDSGVPNALFSTGCTISDLIGKCVTGASKHGRYIECVALSTNAFYSIGAITGQQKGAIQSCAAQANLP